MEYKDTKCDADVAFKTMLITHDERLSQTSCNITEKQEVSNDIIIGMSCDYAAGRASPLANHWNWPLIYPGTRYVMTPLLYSLNNSINIYRCFANDSK